MAVSVFFHARNFILAHWSWVASSSFGVFVLGTRSSPLRFMPTSALLRLAGPPARLKMPKILLSECSDVRNQLVHRVRHGHRRSGSDAWSGVRQRVMDDNRRDLGLQKAFGHLAFEFAIRL